MAEIPNALTVLLWGPSGWQPLDVIYDTLRREQCLSQAGIEERQHVIGMDGGGETGATDDVV